jgi:hypothetical protein
MMEFVNGKDDIRHIVENKSSMVLVSIYLQLDLQTWVILGDFSGISGRFCDPEMIGEWQGPCGFMKQSLEMRQTMGLRDETWELDRPLNNCSNTGRDANFDPNPHWNPRKKTIIYLYLNVLLAHNQSFTQGAMARVNQQSLQPRLGSL